MLTFAQGHSDGETARRHAPGSSRRRRQTRRRPGTPLSSRLAVRCGSRSRRSSRCSPTRSRTMSCPQFELLEGDGLKCSCRRPRRSVSGLAGAAGPDHRGGAAAAIDPGEPRDLARRRRLADDDPGPLYGALRPCHGAAVGAIWLARGDRSLDRSDRRGGVAPCLGRQRCGSPGLHDPGRDRNRLRGDADADRGEGAVRGPAELRDRYLRKRDPVRRRRGRRSRHSAGGPAREAGAGRSPPSRC